jgi:hypothetical protein
MGLVPVEPVNFSPPPAIAGDGGKSILRARRLDPEADPRNICLGGAQKRIDLGRFGGSRNMLGAYAIGSGRTKERADSARD